LQERSLHKIIYTLIINAHIKIIDMRRLMNSFFNISINNCSSTRSKGYDNNDCDDDCEVWSRLTGQDICTCYRKMFDYFCSLKKHWNRQCHNVKQHGYWYSPFINCTPMNGFAWCIAEYEDDSTQVSEDMKKTHKHEEPTEADKQFIMDHYKDSTSKTNYYRNKLKGCGLADNEVMCSDPYPGCSF